MRQDEKGHLVTSIRELLAQKPPLATVQKVYLSANFLWNVAKFQVEMALHVHGLHLTHYSTPEEVTQYGEAEALFRKEFSYIEREKRLHQAEIDLFTWGRERLRQEVWYSSSHEWLFTHSLHAVQKKRVIALLMHLRPLPGQEVEEVVERSVKEPLQVLPLAQLAYLEEQEKKGA